MFPTYINPLALFNRSSLDTDESFNTLKHAFLTIVSISMDTMFIKNFISKKPANILNKSGFKKLHLSLLKKV